MSADFGKKIVDRLRNGATELEVCSYHFEKEEDFLVIGEELKKNETLVELQLKGDRDLPMVIGNDGAIAIGEGLIQNTTLRVLNLRANKIGAEGAIGIGEGLKQNTVLKVLNLRHNTIGSEGAIAMGEGLLRNESLTTLDLTLNYIGAEGAIAIGEGLAQNNTLTTLVLHDNIIRAEGAIAIGEGLAQNNTLTTLDLQRNKIGDEGAIDLIERLSQNNSLAKLVLTDNNIGAQGAIGIVEGLKQNNSLTELYLNKNDICTEGAIAIGQGLAENNSLTRLELGDNSIGAEGAIAIGKGLTENLKLNRLDLGGNKIGDEGAIGIGQELKQNNSLTSLNVYRNNITKKGRNTLYKLLLQSPSIETVYGNDFGRKFDKFKWKRKVHASTLEFSSSQELEQQLLDQPKSSKFLILIQLNNHSEDSDGTTLPSCISRFPDLISLDITETSIASLPSEFSTLSKLKTLNLKSIHSLNDIPPFIVKRGAQEIVRYVGLSKHDWKWKNWCIVGHEGGGKTTMIRTLCEIEQSAFGRSVSRFFGKREKGQKLNEKRTTVETHGLDVIHIAQGEMHYRISDFAGHEEYYITHQYLMMGQSGVYVIVASSVRIDTETQKHVVDLTAAQQEMQFWLQMIQSKVSPYTAKQRRPKIILVLSKADLARKVDRKMTQLHGPWGHDVLQENLDAWAESFQDEFPALRFGGRYIVDDNASDNAMKQLYDQLLELSGRFATQVPRGQIVVQEVLHGMRNSGETIVPVDKLQAFMNQLWMNLEPEEEVRNLFWNDQIFFDSLEGLHHLQEVIWHRESGLVVVNAEWMAKFIGDFERPEAAEAYGEQIGLEDGVCEITDEMRTAMMSKHERIVEEVLARSASETETDTSDQAWRSFVSGGSQESTEDTSESLIDFLCAFEICTRLSDGRLLFPFLKPPVGIDEQNWETYTHRVGRRFYRERLEEHSSSSTSSQPTRPVIPPALPNVLKVHIQSLFGKESVVETCFEYAIFEPSDKPLVVIQHPRIFPTFFDVIVMGDDVNGDEVYSVMESIEEELNVVCGDQGVFAGMINDPETTNSRMVSHPLCDCCMNRDFHTALHVEEGEVIAKTVEEVKGMGDLEEVGECGVASKQRRSARRMLYGICEEQQLAEGVTRKFGAQGIEFSFDILPQSSSSSSK